MRFIAFMKCNISKMNSYIAEKRYFLKIFAFLISEIKEKEDHRGYLCISNH